MILVKKHGGQQMNQNNKSLKGTNVILIIICVMLIFANLSRKTEIETLNYQIDRLNNEIEHQQYSIDELLLANEKENEKSKNADCVFEGFTSYGNGMLTLAGTIVYGLNVQEEIRSVHLVLGDAVSELENNLKGSVDINISKYIEETEIINFYEIKEFYIEYEMQSGTVYQLYPYIWGEEDYGWSEYNEEISCIEQRNLLQILYPDGTETVTEL